MEKSIGGTVFERNGLRFAKTSSGNWIDQYGRIFANTGDKKLGKYLGCGWATH